MPTIPELLHAALKAQGIPVMGVSDKDGQMVVTYAPTASDTEMAAGAALVANFNPSDPKVQEAAELSAARAFGNQPFAKAAARFHHYKTVGPDVPYDDTMAEADTALWERCWKEAAL